MNTLKEYSDIKKQIKTLEDQLDELKPQVMDEIYASGDKTLRTEFGTFTVREKTLYQYSPSTMSMETKLKELKKIEEVDGTATIRSITAYPQFVEKGGKSEF